MSRLIVATYNQGKALEMKAFFGHLYAQVLSATEAGLEIDIIEDGLTFEANARKKAEEIAQIVGCDVLADDSGLEVDALGGAPGVYSARYAQLEGAEGNSADSDNNALVLSRLSVHKRPWTARFVSVLALARPGKQTITARGTVEGEIVPEAMVRPGAHYFGYDPYFFYAPYGKTFGMLSMEEKNAISHRGAAARAMLSLLEDK